MPADDMQNSHTPAHKPEVREDFEKTSRASTPGGSLPVYADYESEKAVIASLLADPDSLKTVMPILSGVAMEEQKGKKKNKKEKQYEKKYTSFPFAVHNILILFIRSVMLQ